MLLLNVWLFVIIAILVAPATPSHKQYSVEKRYTNARKAFRSKINARPQKGSQDVSKKSAGLVVVNYSTKLLQNKAAQQMLAKSMESPFIQKLIKGTLPVKEYQAFLMQDLYHLGRGRDILLGTSKKIEGQYPDFAKIYNIYAAKYDKAYNSALNDLNMKDVKVVPNAATKEYEDFLTYLSENHPRRLAIGFLPYSQSFRTIAGEYMPKIQADNPYQKWFVENYKPPLHENELEKFVDQKAKVGVFTEKDLEIYL